MNTLDTFEHLILHQTATELVPFLLTIEKKDVLVLREKLKSLHKSLLAMVQLSENSWGSRATPEQFSNLFLSGFAVYSRREALGDGINGAWAIGAYAVHKPALKQHFITVVTSLRPSWLPDWLMQLHASGRGEWAIDYELLRVLEREQLIPYSPTITARSFPQVLTRWGWEMSQQDSIPLNAVELLAARLRADSTFMTRDLPLIFDFESLIPQARAHIQPPLPSPQEIANWDTSVLHPWQIWDAKHPSQSVGWQQLLLHLAATGHLNRADLLTRCLLSLRRDFRRPLLTWFKELFLALKPTVAERLARQADLVELLAHPLPLVVNFAIEQLKNVWVEPGFNLAPLLLYAENLLLRADLKTGLKTLLAGLAKLAAQAIAPAPAVAHLLAAALAHPDGAVQEGAAKGLASLLNAKKPTLSTTENAAVTATLATQAELLGAAARLALAPWLASAAAPGGLPATAAYGPSPQFVPDISPATAIVPVADWHELLFLTGQVLKHDDPAALERWLDGLLHLHGQLPAGHQAQLQPYVHRVLPQLKKATEVEAAAFLAGPIQIWGHDGLAEALMLGWATGFQLPRAASVEVLGNNFARTPLLAVEKQRYVHAEHLLRSQQALPLLSTPTHAPYWVAPTQLVAKLLTYEAAGQEPAVADLALALARTAHGHLAEAAAAGRLLPQLHHAGLRELLTWFLNGPTAPLPAPASAAEPTRQPGDPESSLAEALPELWAVAARTKAPHQAFPTLPAWLGYDYAGAAQPLHPAPEVVPQEAAYQEFHKPGQPTTTHRWTEMHWGSAASGAAPSALLLYSPPAPKVKHNSWEHNLLLATDFPYLAALLPNYAAPLYEYTLRCAAWADNLEASERDLVAQALRSLLAAGPAHAPAASILLASGLLHHTPLCRSLGQEVLVQAVANGQLLPGTVGQVLGQQLATGYAPVPRLADSLAQVSGIDGPTDDALRQLLDALLPELPAAPPRNLRRLLELYADLRARTGQPVPAAVQSRLHDWSTAAALKKTVTTLLLSNK